MIAVDQLLEGLNDDQRQAVVYGDGPLMVLAGAGSGKTRVLTHRAAWLVAKGHIKANQLLLLTFTNKAASEMKDRLLQLLSASGGCLVGNPFAGTFHSFCAQVLRIDGSKIDLDPSFVIYDASDQNALIKNLIDKMNLSEKDAKPKLISSLISSAKTDLIDPATFVDSISESWMEPVAEIYQQYQKELKSANAVDFDDLLFLAIKLFKNKKDILQKYRNHYQHILIDEYQDTNRCQYVLTKLLAMDHENLTVVGDAAQAIYSWRGADYRNLTNLAKDFKTIKVINLEQNYRSTQTILDAANAVIVKNEKHPTLKLFTNNNSGEPIILYQASSGVDEAQFVAERIKQLTDFSGINPAQIAILYRTNSQSRTLEEALIRSGISYILIGGTKFYDRAEVKDVLCLIRVFYNPADTVSWQRIEANFGKRRKARVEEFINKNSKKEFVTENLFEKILLTSGYLEKYDPKDEDDYRRLENIKELVSVARQFPDLGQFLENVALVQQEYSSQEKEKQGQANNAVKLMTLHSSKGLEFEVVFLVGLEEGLLPHSRSIDDINQLEEERRLCYVGLTRAKKKLFLSFAKRRLYFGKNNYNDPSRFLADIPQNLLKLETNTQEDSWSDDWDDDDWDTDW